MSSYPTEAEPSPSPGDGRPPPGDGRLPPGDGRLPPGDGRLPPGDGPASAAASTDSDPAPGGGVAADVAADLAGLRDSPVEDHPDIYQGVHDRLRATLSGIDNL